MKTLNAAAWLLVLLCLAYYVYSEKYKLPAQNCQVYDRFGHGIGCDESDLGDL